MTDGVVEGERALGHLVASAAEGDAVIVMGVTARVVVDLAMARLDAPLMRAFENGMGGDQKAVRNGVGI